LGTDSAEAGTVPPWRTAAKPAADPDDEHFVPPPPPPLPSLEPLTKAAWAALFGGPAYLLIATAAGWSMPGIAVFCAIAAFVAGVALLVLRLNDSGPPSSGDDDNGAVV
jgi:membrane associated rhomboid family serine protease